MSAAEETDPFDTLLSLEEQYYAEGYNLGVADGSRAGRIEGRVFGLEKGFEKFAAMGALAGRSAIWEARLPKPATGETKTNDQAVAGESQIQSLPGSARLEAHVRTLSALTEAESLSTQNNEDDVSNFDDRLKRAEGKAKVIEQIIREKAPVAAEASNSAQDAKGGPRQVRVKRNETGGESNMEDFNVPRIRS